MIPSMLPQGQPTRTAGQIHLRDPASGMNLPPDGMPECTAGRRLPESNRCKRLCRPLRSHSAKAPGEPRARRAGDSQAAEGIRTLDLLHGKQTL